MRLTDVGFIFADTSRSRAYLCALIRNKLLPAYVLILGGGTDNVLPGQLKAETIADLPADLDPCWSEADFNATVQIKPLLEEYCIPYEIALTRDVNSQPVINLISQRSESVFIFSGFGGVLVGDALLATSKKFLHVHGGYLPFYKGSTTNYFSLIDDNTMGASSIFLNKEIDSGAILLRRKFTPPSNRQDIDHRYDSAARAMVLVETLQQYVTLGRWEFEIIKEDEAEVFYIIHPVLKHIAILDKGE